MKVAAVCLLVLMTAVALTEAFLRNKLPFQKKVVITTAILEAVSSPPGVRVAKVSPEGPEIPGKRRQRQIKTVDGHDVYDAIYTLEGNGRRLVPGEQSGVDSVLFFGCSLMFGQGLADRETTPAAFVETAAGKWSAINFAQIGYGPHQMLALFEGNAVAKAVAGRRPIAGVYLAFNDHVRRAAGLVSWDTNGPRYVLDADGRPRRAGSFDTGLRRRIALVLLKSRVVERLAARWWNGQAEQLLYAAIVSETSRRFDEAFHAPFLVLFWPRGSRAGREQDAKSIALLREQGVDVSDISGPLGYIDAPDSRFLIPEDGHPNGAANAVIGRAVIELLERAVEGSGRYLP